MAKKVLMIDYEKCTGCRLCELVCSVRHEGVSNPSRSRITVVKWEAEGIYIPMTCQQCEDAPCVAVCPVKALYHDEELGRVMIDYERCIGCRTCISVCPFGGMGFDWVAKRVIKCDLCDGDPQCVRFCEVGALEYVEAEKVGAFKRRGAAQRFSSASKIAESLQSSI